MLRIRPAEEAEFPQVRAFYYALIDEMQSAVYKPRWEKGVYPSDDYLLESTRSGQLYLGFCGGTPAAAMIVNHAANAGYAGVVWGVEAQAQEVTVIHALGVRPAFGGQGFAKEMVRGAMALAKRNGQKAIRLDVLAGNLPAERLYAAMGFRYVKTVNLFYEDTGWTDFLLYEYLL